VKIDGTIFEINQHDVIRFALMNRKLITHCLRVTFIVYVAFFSMSLKAQKSKNWWRSAKVDTLKVDTILNESSDSTFSSLIPLPRKDSLGEIVLNMDSAINAIYIKNYKNPSVLTGYRIQIYFGDLNTAREVRAKCRKQMNHNRIYLEAIDPNYSVAVGDYRDRWEAEHDLSKLSKTYKDALIIPAKIELPELK